MISAETHGNPEVTELERQQAGLQYSWQDCGGISSIRRYLHAIQTSGLGPLALEAKYTNNLIDGALFVLA